MRGFYVSWIEKSSNPLFLQQTAAVLTCHTPEQINSLIVQITMLLPFRSQWQDLLFFCPALYFRDGPNSVLPRFCRPPRSSPPSSFVPTTLPSLILLALPRPPVSLAPTLCLT